MLTDSKGKEDVRTVLRLHPALAPFKAAVLPLAKKLAPVAEPIYEELAKYFSVDYDVTGSIGKRYRREDEIGTPFSICVDFDTENDGLRDYKGQRHDGTDSNTCRSGQRIYRAKISLLMIKARRV